MFGCVGEAARVAQRGGFLDGKGYRSGRWSGISDGVVDSAADERIISMIGFDAVEVEVVGVHSGIKSGQVAEEVLPIAARTE